MDWEKELLFLQSGIHINSNQLKFLNIIFRRLLKLSGVRVTAIKIDPYLNVDAGTMSPFEHGETFVLDDGGETDLDLGNYERYIYHNLILQLKSLFLIL